MAATLTISDAARASGVSAHTLRYYEREGLLEPVDRAASGHRRYAEEDLARIALFVKLRATGMPIRRLREYAELLRAGDDTYEERIALLEEHRAAVVASLEETQRTLDLIDFKLDLYRRKAGRS